MDKDKEVNSKNILNEYVAKDEILYYGRAFPEADTYEIMEVKVKDVKENYFTAIDKTEKHTYLFEPSAIDKYIFRDRESALKYVDKIEEENKDKKGVMIL